MDRYMYVYSTKYPIQIIINCSIYMYNCSISYCVLYGTHVAYASRDTRRGAKRKGLILAPRMWHDAV
jgi:hypothetical protein